MPLRLFRQRTLRPLAALALALACLAAPLGAQRDTTRAGVLTRGTPTTQQGATRDTGRAGTTDGQTTTEGRGGLGIRLRPSTVPDVRGMTLVEARARLVRAGLLPGRVDSTASEARPGTVVAQGPQPGTTVMPGYPIRMTLARAEQTVSVPDLSGSTSAAARAALANARLALGDVTSAESSADEGTVIGQKPAAGAAVRPGAAVSVTVAAARLVAVPALTGQPLPRAETALREAGLRMGGVERAPGTGAPGRVLAQSRAAGERVRAGTSVDLMVAIGTVAVPDLGGRTLAQAREALRVAGLRPGGVDSVDASRTAGTVAAQSPAAGTQAAPGSPVSVSLARAPLVAVPRVVGRTPGEAARALGAAGLSAGGAGADSASVVLAQAPAAGTRVPPGTRVDLQFSTAAVPPTPVDSAAGSDSARAGDPPGGPAPGGAIDLPTQRVPDLVGVTLAEARERLAPLRLRHEVDPALADSVSWMVTAQEPAAGAAAEAGTRIRLALAPPAVPERPASGESAGPPWPWLIAALLLLAAAAFVARRGRGGNGRGATPAGPPPTVVLSDARWDPGAPEVRAEGALLRGPEVVLRAAGDRGVQRVEVKETLIAAEVAE